MREQLNKALCGIVLREAKEAKAGVDNWRIKIKLFKKIWCYLQMPIRCQDSLGALYHVTHNSEESPKQIIFFENGVFQNPKKSWGNSKKDFPIKGGIFFIFQFHAWRDKKKIHILFLDSRSMIYGFGNPKSILFLSQV